MITDLLGSDCLYTTVIGALTKSIEIIEQRRNELEKELEHRKEKFIELENLYIQRENILEQKIEYLEELQKDTSPYPE